MARHYSCHEVWAPRSGLRRCGGSVLARSSDRIADPAVTQCARRLQGTRPTKRRGDSSWSRRTLISPRIRRRGLPNIKRERPPPALEAWIRCNVFSELTGKQRSCQRPRLRSKATTMLAASTARSQSPRSFFAKKSLSSCASLTHAGSIAQVAANFHITAGKSIHHARGHAHLAHVVPPHEVNFSHRIDRLSFSDEEVGGHTLDGDVQVADERTTMYQYFIKVCLRFARSPSRCLVCCRGR